MAAPKAKAGALEIAPVETTTRAFGILGKRPIILNRLSEKTKRELLAPAGRKTSAQKQSTLKHDPFAEFRAAPYILKEDHYPTYLGVMSSAFKGAMATAALDLPGAKKAQIGRLVWVEDDFTPLYGIPELSMAPVRSSDINHTPDIRTRAIVKHWACEIKVTFVETLIKEQAILNLLVAGGLTVGVGDWRNEKGKGTYGQFLVVSMNDPVYRAIREQGGRVAQMAAMKEPACADAESEELLTWWMAESKRRGFYADDDFDTEAEGDLEGAEDVELAL